MKRIFFSLGLLTLVACPLFAQTSNLGLAADQPQEQPSRFPTELEVSLSPKDIVYATKDTSVLKMDIYRPQAQDKALPCLVFLYGGGFSSGSKDNKTTVEFCHQMTDRGYVVVAINYRHGMAGVKNKGFKMVRSLERAIGMAVEDLYSATDFLLKNAESIGIDPSLIMISGSSAGAVTVLQADYELANRFERTALLPEDFGYAGVIAFAGGVFSREGKPGYQRQPAPTFFFHGKEDRMVKYKSTQFFNIGFFGSHALTKRFKKFDFPYVTYRFEDMGHEMAVLPMQHYQDEIDRFIKSCVLEGCFCRKDSTITDHGLPKADYGKWRLSRIYE
ncbi:MAG TPA: alpha/beta hydrolase [Bacteroidales bacterium]|jgi:predicted esterase|nr:alpha/beta hydrolase [Bacteroidales bacterium]